MHINNETASVTLTSEIGAWFFLVTCPLDMQNTSAKLYGNHFMQYKVMSWTQKNSDTQTDGQMDSVIFICPLRRKTTLVKVDPLKATKPK